MIYWIGFIGLEIFRNYYLIVKKHERPNYAGSFMFRAFFGLVGIAIMYPEFDPLGDYRTLYGALPALIFEVTSFYLLFDPILNWSRKLPWDYQGKNSGWIDKLGKKWYYVFKIACLIWLILTVIILI